MTVHISGAQAILDHMMADPRGPGIIHSVTEGLRTGRWSDEYVDSIGQVFHCSRSSWPMAQVAAFTTIHGMIDTGRVAMVPVGTDGTPHRDSDRQANAAALSSLPRPFTAEVNMEQNNGDFDGMVYWSEPIEVSVATGIFEREARGLRPISLHTMIPPGSASLEIGTSPPSRTWMHLVVEGGAVARWPYGHERFRLFVNLNHREDIERRAAAMHRSVRSARSGAPVVQESLW